MSHDVLSVLLALISDSGFKATFKCHTRIIHPGTKYPVQIEFIPEFEGEFEATLQLIFVESQQLKRFAVSIGLQAVAGSLEDHKRFESLTQHRYIPLTGIGEQIPPEKVILLPSSVRQFGNLPEYELPALVQQAVDKATVRRPYDKRAQGLITQLRPRKLTMDTYAKYFRALLNVEEGHQQ